jgi:N-acetylglucosamine kinase-like BadF-type ATPase
MAGVDRPADTALVGGWARAFAGGAPVEVVNDARLVLEAVDASHSPHGDGRVHLAGSAPPWGLAVIGGTGSIVYGWDAQGRSARAGGWGYLLGDEGSGYAVGLAGLRAVTKAHDGTGSPTLLAERILSALGLDAPPDLIRWMYRAPLPRAEVAALSRVVEASAAEGDPLAAAILEEAGRDLAAAAVAVAARLGLNGPIPCGMAGGALVRGPGLGAAFLRGAQGLGLRLAPAVRVEEPVLGALRIAARQKQP